MSETTIRILMIDDDEDDALLIRRLLGGVHGARYPVDWAASYEEGLATLCENRHDIGLLDYSLGARNGLDLLRESRKRQCRVPVIMLTGLGAEEVDQAAMEAGALDYLSKRELTASHLERSIRYSLQQDHTLQALRQAQKDLERKVEERTAQIRLQATALEAAANGIAITDAGGKIQWVNPAFSVMTGYSPREVIGQNLSILKSGAQDRDFYRTLWVTIRQGEVWHGEIVNRRKDGTLYTEEMTIAPVRGDGDEINHYVAIKQDITQRKATEQALLAANERLAEADKRKDEFLAMLAHELRNPLAPIRYAVQMLHLTGARQENLERQRKVIDRQVSHMGRLLDDLLDISRITRGKIALKREIVDLRTVALHAIESTRPMIEVRGQHLHYESVDSPLPVHGDPTRLEQIIRNLLHNANKYTESGGDIGLHLGFEAGERGMQALVRVSDSGIGIAPDVLPHVFEAFVQAEQSLARSQGGLGIGLAMVRNLVQLHDGSVEAHSAGAGRGSEFVVKLPLAETAAMASAKPPENKAAERMQVHSCRVLVVEDNEDAAASLSDLLGLWGHEVRTACDGPQALDAAREWRPEVILLDIGLPGMDGYQVARHLRHEPATRNACVVALTGYGAEEDRRRAQEAGFNHHLTKPVEMERLQSILRSSCAA